MKSTSCRKKSESQRMREYRAAKKAQLSELDKELYFLKGKLAQLQQTTFPVASSIVTADRTRLLAHIAHARAENANLRAEATRHGALADVMATWVASQRPIQALLPRSSWIESTLLADPVARRQGFQWLSDRVFHTAVAAAPTRPARPPALLTDPSLEHPLMSFDMHVCDDDNGPMTIAAFENQLHMLLFANFRHAADVTWAGYMHNDYNGVSVIPSSPLRERIHDHLGYFCGMYDSTGLQSCRIMAKYEADDRIVITFCMVAKDELLPIVHGTFRTHGFGWISFERVTDGITALHHGFYHLTPLTATQGRAALDDVASIYGLPREDQGATPEVCLARLRATTEQHFSRGYLKIARELRQRSQV
ncbi:Aste57867_13291 [Aphanomyces stellatus]|uniref:Aste57867_13291 protein n=1 Tax=Aphanomyces stellatus TaxID=120398 RepID=A0A485KYG0_9STRA|nr:hypothetical protein As57867_013242 [Aphanomyces stellatus]VFT90130.1 Aste57867_13291 [Aphanomyces stellatus]